MVVPIYKGHTIGPLSLTGRGSVCLHTQIHFPAQFLSNRGCPAAISAAWHAHRVPGDAPGARPLVVFKRETPYDVHPG